MKRISILLLCLVSVFTGFAQKKVKLDGVNEKGSKVVGLGFGVSITGVFINGSVETDSVKYIGDSRLALNASYDFYITNRFSIGVQASNQHFKVNVKEWIFINEAGLGRTVQNVNSKMNRMYLGARMLMHYKNNAKIDVYSGIRLGLVHWTNKMNTNDAEFIKEFESNFPIFTRPALGITAIGARVKITPEFSGNLELNLGVPHLFSIGASYRF